MQFIMLLFFSITIFSQEVDPDMKDYVPNKNPKFDKHLRKIHKGVKKIQRNVKQMEINERKYKEKEAVRLDLTNKKKLELESLKKERLSAYKKIDDEKEQIKQQSNLLKEKINSLSK